MTGPENAGDTEEEPDECSQEASYGNALGVEAHASCGRCVDCVKLFLSFGARLAEKDGTEGFATEENENDLKIEQQITLSNVNVN